MLILGIEAAAKVAGAAVYEDGRILASSSANSGLTHSQTLLPMIDRVLKGSGRKLDQVDYIALTNGPGSFTGLRIGAATAKGLGLGAGIRIIPVCTLESLAYNSAWKEGIIRVVIMDARRHQVYCAAYDQDGTVIEPDTIPPLELAEKLKQTQGPLLFVGDASDLYHDLFASELGSRYHLAPAHLKDLSAASLCSLAAEKVAKDPSCAVETDQLTINYLRKPQAVREREARLAKEQADREDAQKAGEKS